MGINKFESVICPAPWLHHCVNTNGKNRLCCNSQTSKTAFNEDFDTYWNGPEVRDVRAAMRKGERHSRCKECWDKEDLGISSLRQGMIGRLQLEDRWEDFLSIIDTDPETPIEIDLKLGNYCNLACRMCSSYSSSQVQNEMQRIYRDTGQDIGEDDYEIKFRQHKWYNSDVFIDRIKHFSDNGLRFLKFTGGEPFMVPAVRKIIDYYIERGLASETVLSFITNGTLVTQEWLDMFDQFKFVSINISVDGVGDVYEYIRHPGKWDDFDSKLNMIAAHSASRRDMFVNLVFTLQIYNMLSIKDMVKLADSHKLSIEMIPLNKPEYIDVCHAPAQLKQQAQDLIAQIQTTVNLKFVESASKKIDQIGDPESVRNRFLEITALKDQYKNQDGREMEFWKYYE